MASATSLPIAKLRAAGCKVSTVIGHDPKHGMWFYVVTLPGGDERYVKAFVATVAHAKLESLFLQVESSI